LRLHLAELVRLEYAAPLSGRFGSRFRYRLTVEPEQIAEGGRLIVGLKDLETLRREARIAGFNCPSGSDNLAGLGANLARENPNLASVGGKRIYVLRSEVRAAPAPDGRSEPHGLNGREAQ
jgi:hypothetical protein